MPKQKNIEIKNLFYDDLDGMLKKTLKAVAKKQKVSRKEFNERIGPKLNQIRELYEERISATYLSKNKFDLARFIEGHIKNQKVIVEQNAASFSAFLIYVNACAVIYNKLTKAVEKRRVDPTLKITLSLYGLITRRAMEIADVLINGYVDAAMIIWRSMYENSVTLLVLALQDKAELSRRYLDHSMRHFSRKYASYVQNHQELGFKPLPKSEHLRIERKRKKLVEKYGASFLKNDYSWADPLVKGRVTFRSLEDLAGLGRFRPFYNLCSEQTHAGFNGLGKYFENKKLILPRITQQEVGLNSFIDPMQFTIAILHEVNDYIIWQFSTETERNANMLLLRKTFEKLLSTFDTNGAVLSSQQELG